MGIGWSWMVPKGEDNKKMWEYKTHWRILEIFEHHVRYMWCDRYTCCTCIHLLSHTFTQTCRERVRNPCSRMDWMAACGQPIAYTLSNGSLLFSRNADGHVFWGHEKPENLDAATRILSFSLVLSFLLYACVFPFRACMKINVCTCIHVFTYIIVFICLFICSAIAFWWLCREARPAKQDATYRNNRLLQTGHSSCPLQQSCS